MLDWLPFQLWVLPLIVVIGWAPATYVLRYIASSPSRRDITAPPPDVSWRDPGKYSFNLLVMGGLAALAIGIWFPVVEQYARSPRFLPDFLIGAGGVGLFRVLSDLANGQAEIRDGTSGPHDLYEHPRRYWLTMARNLASSVFVLVAGLGWPY